MVAGSMRREEGSRTDLNGKDWMRGQLVIQVPVVGND